MIRTIVIIFTGLVAFLSLVVFFYKIRRGISISELILLYLFYSINLSVFLALLS